MTTIIYYIIIFGVAFATSFLATPQIIRLAYKANIVDVPKDNRRMHKKAIARMGGVAIIIRIICCPYVICNTFSFCTRITS